MKQELANRGKNANSIAINITSSEDGAAPVVANNVFLGTLYLNKAMGNFKKAEASKSSKYFDSCVE